MVPTSETHAEQEKRARICEYAKDVLGQIIDKPFTGAMGATKEGKGWRVLTEVIERRAMIDTEDIIGIYEVRLDENGEVMGFERIGLRSRKDLSFYTKVK